jgi:2-iminobutanoate/2-iminopropanoate deaminase
MSIERIGPPAAGGPAFSKAVRAGDFVFLSGQVPTGPDGKVAAGGIEGQTKQSMENIKETLTSLGLGFADVVKSTVWLKDTKDFPAFNSVYRAYFGEALPARSTVRAELMIDCLIEIEVIAYAPKA